MIHTLDNCYSPNTARRKYPNAAILRNLGDGIYLAFDRVEDAEGHPSTRRMDQIYAPA